MPFPFRFECSHCRTQLGDGERSCSNCGAPVLGAASGSSEAPYGSKTFEDRWRGFRCFYPEGWKTFYPTPSDIVFEHPKGKASLVVVSLPPNPVADAEQQAQMLLKRFGRVEVLQGRGNQRDQAALGFRNEQLEGRIFVRLSPAGCVAVYGAKLRDTSIAIELLVGALLESMSAIPKLPRQRYISPLEASFEMLVPKGWEVRPNIKHDGFCRVTECLVLGDPSGNILINLEAGASFLFVDVPDAPRPTPDESMLDRLGRWARTAESAMVNVMGAQPMPLRGLEPFARRFFEPMVQGKIPGAKLIDFRDFGNPDLAHLRFSYPTGEEALFLVSAVRMPPMMSSPGNHWLARIIGAYHAPAELMVVYEPILLGVMNTFTVNPAWMAAQQSHGNLVAQRQVDAMNRQADQSRQAIASAMSDISDGQHQSWMRQQGWIDRGHASSIDAVRDVQLYDAVDAGGTPIHVEAPAHFDQVLSDPLGNLYGADWTVEVPADWTKLEPTKSR